jgi:hypothetical protein
MQAACKRPTLSPGSQRFLATGTCGSRTVRERGLPSACRRTSGSYDAVARLASRRSIRAAPEDRIGSPLRSLRFLSHPPASVADHAWARQRFRARTSVADDASAQSPPVAVPALRARFPPAGKLPRQPRSLNSLNTLRLRRDWLRLRHSHGLIFLRVRKWGLRLGFCPAVPLQHAHCQCFDVGAHSSRFSNLTVSRPRV